MQPACAAYQNQKQGMLVAIGREALTQGVVCRMYASVGRQTVVLCVTVCTLLRVNTAADDVPVTIRLHADTDIITRPTRP